MTNVSRKGIWAIVLGSLAVAVLIFFAWATSGFVNWNAASWFNYWGKGAVVKTVEVSTEQKAMVLYSADVDHDIVTDSEDGSFTFASSKLPTPQLSLSYDNRVLRIEISGTLGDNIGLFFMPWNTEGYSTSKYETLSSSRFTGTTTHVYEYPFSSLYTKLSSYNTMDFYCDELSANCFGIFAVNSKTGYLSSDYSSVLYLMLTKEIGSGEFSATTYSLDCYASLLEYRAFDFKICSSQNENDIVLNPYVSAALSDYAYYVSGRLCVNLLLLSDELAKKPSFDVYYFIFNYKAFTFNHDSNQYTFYPFLMNYRKTNSFAVKRLATPTNFKYNAGTLTWDSVDGATGYGVFWTENNEEKKAFVDTTSYTFDLKALGEGEHTVRVRALGNMGQTFADKGNIASLTAYNASNVVMQVVALTYNVDGDTITKFVSYGSKVSDYLYDVNISGREFGGWYYDSGFSRPVVDSDVIDDDMIIYARLSDRKVTEQQLSWWDQYKWHVLIPCFVAVGLIIIAAVVVTVRKKKNA